MPKSDTGLGSHWGIAKCLLFTDHPCDDTWKERLCVDEPNHQGDFPPYLDGLIYNKSYAPWKVPLAEKTKDKTTIKSPE